MPSEHTPGKCGPTEADSVTLRAEDGELSESDKQEARKHLHRRRVYSGLVFKLLPIEPDRLRVVETEPSETEVLITEDTEIHWRSKSDE